jgi:mono/diheme cytochrome c family protein
MLKPFFMTAIPLGLCAVSFLGFRGQKFSDTPLQIFSDMKHQPKVITQHASIAFADGRGDRELVQGTLPRGYALKGRYSATTASNVGGSFAAANDYYNTGSQGGFYGAGFPVKVDAELLARGENRYNIHCAVCHDSNGSGNGPTKSLGLATVASLIDDRIRVQPEGQLFATITHGKNTMGAYGPNIAVKDRWAIVAHVRALQAQVSTAASEIPENIKSLIK